MSLNGLDVNAVVEAHQSALADPGGWFLLKYANRDTVEVLSRGNGGVAECKGAVDQYVEKSPLYGMLQYRRKRVLLKYVPEGTSRLLQVRMSVQFQSVLDAFPHDTIFSFSAATELVESALGQCTMLQPANGASLQSSSSSLRQRRLNEISEDAEDLVMPMRRDESAFAQPEPINDILRSDGSDISTLPASALRAKALLAKRKEENEAALRAGPTLFSHSSSLSQPYISVRSPPSVTSEPPRPLNSLDQLRLRDAADVATASTHRIDLEPSPHPPRQFHHSRHLSENESKTIAQWNEEVAEFVLPLPQPKKKLGPRPHVEPQVRPKTANQDDDHSTRLVANLPQSVRLTNRPNPHLINRPGSQQSTRSVPTLFMPAHNFPPLPDFNQLRTFQSRPESRKAGSVTSSALMDLPAASPEKLRLLKALQQRKRNQILTQRAASAQPSFASNRDDFPLGMSSSTQLRPTEAVPTTIQEETAQPTREVKGVNDSSTASPTSIATTSDDPSTRPSSYAEDRKSRSSRVSVSHDTDSSSTPKATSENTRTASKKHTSWYDSAPDLHDDDDVQTSVTPKMSMIHEERAENTSGLVPSKERQIVSEAVKTQDRSALSWLASDSQLDVLQTLISAGPHDVLSIDTMVQPSRKASADLSEDEDDESLAELHEATVHEATPVSVKRPPLTPTMRTYSHDRSRATTRSSSSLVQSFKSSPSAQEKSPSTSSNGVSTALPQWPPGKDNEPMAVPFAKKATLGHGISNRIKALEDSSRRASGISSSPSTNDGSLGRSTMSNFTKRMSFISQLGTSNTSPEASREGTKQVTATADVARPSARKQDTKFQTTPADIKNSLDRSTSSQDQLGLPFKSSQPQDTTKPPVLPDPHSAFLDTDPAATEKKRFSFASYRSGQSHKSGTNAKWMQQESMASRVSLGRESKASRKAPSEASSVNDEKRGSRASRLMKRLSGFGTRPSGKGQPGTQSKEEIRPDPIIEQNENATPRESTASSVMQMVDIGDVNVQFPEALLWKRRFLRIDDQGYLIFSAPTDVSMSRTTNRKFHLGDIQEPCLPDSEREEIAWSVLLDLRDGNCIQCACESKQGQAKVLKLLLDAHSAYHSLYPDALER